MSDDNLYKPLSSEYTVPTNKAIAATRRPDKDGPCTYLCGNSLGLQSNSSKARINEELAAWQTHGVVGHFAHPLNRPWVSFPDNVHPLLAEIVGAEDPSEVACMSTLTANLHLMMNSFYKPTPNRYKILCEARAFPSDQYAFASQVLSHGFEPQDAIIQLSPRDGEFILRPEDILSTIDSQGPTIALVLFSGIQYYTGQLFPIQDITQKAKQAGCICGWDLAHAVGNVPLSLHDWDVDFAVWCTYKYLNSGPGGIAGLFMHNKWDEKEKPKSAGWWGHELSTRFDMPPDFRPIPGAQGFQQSNPSILTIASLLGSLETFKAAGKMPIIRERSLQLTNRLERLLQKSKFFVKVAEVDSNKSEIGFTIITPTEPIWRGAQLSLLILPRKQGLMRQVFDGLVSYGVIGDEREPDVIRLAPAPLYNSFKDCEDAAKYLDMVLEEQANRH